MMQPTLPRSKTRSGAAYVARGDGGETIVLIHGVGMRIEAWGPQIDYLARECRVIAVDLPGHGESAPLEQSRETPAQLGHFVAWFRTVLEDLALEDLGSGPVNVAGHSMGALIATGIAAGHAPVSSTKP